MARALGPDSLDALDIVVLLWIAVPLGSGSCCDESEGPREMDSPDASPRTTRLCWPCIDRDELLLGILYIFLRSQEVHTAVQQRATSIKSSTCQA